VVSVVSVLVCGGAVPVRLIGHPGTSPYPTTMDGPGKARRPAANARAASGAQKAGPATATASATTPQPPPSLAPSSSAQASKSKAAGGTQVPLGISSPSAPTDTSVSSASPAAGEAKQRSGKSSGSKAHVVSRERSQQNIPLSSKQADSALISARVEELMNTVDLIKLRKLEIPDIINNTDSKFNEMLSRDLESECVKLRSQFSEFQKGMLDGGAASFDKEAVEYLESALSQVSGMMLANRATLTSTQVAAIPQPTTTSVLPISPLKTAPAGGTKQAQVQSLLFALKGNPVASSASSVSSASSLSVPPALSVPSASSALAPSPSVVHPVEDSADIGSRSTAKAVVNPHSGSKSETGQSGPSRPATDSEATVAAATSGHFVGGCRDDRAALEVKLLDSSILPEGALNAPGDANANENIAAVTTSIEGKLEPISQAAVVGRPEYFNISYRYDLPMLRKIGVAVCGSLTAENCPAELRFDILGCSSLYLSGMS
jgi:hypothetical protein